jgi:hypothetical protein
MAFVLAVALFLEVSLPFTVGVAVAAKTKTFGIAKFTNQTTGPTRIVPLHGGSLGAEEAYEFVNEPDGFIQAGGHPWGLTTKIEFNNEVVEQEQTGGEIQFRHVPSGDVKDTVVTLPPGFIGDPMATPRCSLTRALAYPKEECPASTQVGVFHVVWFGGKQFIGPIVNVTPEAGQSAEFVLQPRGALPAVLTGHLVRTYEGYGLTVAGNDVPGVELLSVETTFWGVPADPSHDVMRGMSCSSSEWGTPLNSCSGGGKTSGVEEVPFLTMGTDCAAGPQEMSIRVDSWEHPGSIGVNGEYSREWVKAATEMPGLAGCGLLSFNPQIEVQPDSLLADAPVGLGVSLKVPQFEEPERLGTSHLRDATVTFPLGMSVSPGVVDGIQACEATGPEGINITGPLSEQAGPSGELQLAPGRCPNASTLGTAEAITPLLSEPIRGHLYLARPGCGGAGRAECSNADALDGNLYKMYLELGGKEALRGTGIEIKVEGQVDANPATGQLTARFSNNPQTPFSELKVDLNGGPRAPLDNPATCGAAVTTADFTPWSAPGVTPQGIAVAGIPDATPLSEFSVGGCSQPEPFAPGFLAGTVTPQAARFSSFTLNLSRKDREQYVKGIQVHTPPGMLAVLSSVTLCGEPEADAGTCPRASKIGTTRVASGAGSHPFEIEGTVYLTGPHEGSPFGLSIVTHAVAGPFDLGLVVVRAGLDIDQDDSTAIITTDESGPYAIPQLLFGVPLRLQRVTANIDRPSFIFNPTNCQPQQVTAKVMGSQQTLAAVSSPFAVAGCKALAFKPKFSVSTNGHTSRRLGASIDAKLAFPVGAFGSEANVAKVKVKLPKLLPSRLSTLQKACRAETFGRNPALCPKGSIIGIARAFTPLLPALPKSNVCVTMKGQCPSVAGPVYFVSHGGEAFPQLVMVLEGDGVRVDVVGDTFIDKHEVTSTTIKAVPDVPVSSFELYLPQDSNSALAATGNLCKSSARLLMPTEFTAQNGAVVKQNTKIAVVGCGKAPKSRRIHR